MAEHIKKVSKKKILFVQIDEELTQVFERIEKLSYKEVYLVVPKRAVLLQSVVNLKILKQKLAEIGKDLALITNDLSGMKLAMQAEIKVFDQWQIHEEKSGSNNKMNEDPETTLLKPIAAAQNEVGEDLPSRLPKKKSSIFDVVHSIQDREKGFSLRAYLADFKRNRLERKPLSLYLTPGRKRWLFGLFGASLLVFFVIVYIVLPGATVAIEPASAVVSKAVNITLEPDADEVRSLKVYEIETQVKYTLSHPATGIESEGQNASGNLTIINVSGTERTLVKETRFQTEEGIVFRLQKEVTVTAGILESPSKLEVFVVADALDANGAPVGDRGNIGPAQFFLPGLREDSQDDLYAESYTAMSGGTTLIHTRLTEDDLIAAEEKLERDLQEKSLASLRKEVLSLSNSQGLKLKLLEDSDALEYGPALIDLPYSLVGQEMKDFDLSGSLSVRGVAYDRELLYSILKTEMVNAKTPGKQLISVDEDSISIQVLEADMDTLNFKMTAQIQGIEEYEIDPELEGGAELASKIKEHIAGKSIEEAKNYVQNLPEVNRVEIRIWPVWSPTISSLPENIKIKSLSESDFVDEADVDESLVEEKKL